METLQNAIPVQESENTKVIALYTIIKDGNGMEYKVCNMSHPDICKRNGHVTVEAIRKSKRHETNISFTNVKDKNTGIIYGIVQGIDPIKKHLVFQRIRVGDREEYDLTNLQDAMVWAVVSRHSTLEGSPYQDGRPIFKVHNKEEEAEKIITKTKERDRASQIAQQLKGLQLGDMCRNLGIAPEHSSHNLMLAQILESANNDPKRFLDVWDNTNRSVVTIINRAKAVGLLRFDTMKGWLWRDGLPVGSNEAQMVDYLIKNVALLTTIDTDSKEIDTFYKKHGTDSGIMPTSTKSETDKLKTDLEKELEEVRALKEELTKNIQYQRDKSAAGKVPVPEKK